MKGTQWASGPISNAVWAGARLVDILQNCGLDFNDKNIKHVQFQGYDSDISSTPYQMSIEADTVHNSIIHNIQNS